MHFSTAIHDNIAIAVEDNELDKSENASPFKLKRAREKGTIARGIDLGFFAALAAFVTYAWISGPEVASRIALVASKTFRDFAQFADAPSALLPQLAAMVGAITIPMLVFAATLFSVVLVIEFLQVGPVFTVQTLKPDFKRINPAEGFKRLFSFRIMLEALKSVIKLAVYGMITWLVIDATLSEDISGLYDSERLLSAMADKGFKLLFFFAIAAMFIAAIDQMLSRREFAKKMRMSRRELKREHRDHEGDPRLKQKRRDFHTDFLTMAKSLRGARDADVILTNPTHYAVALRYDPAKMISPTVVSRGSGALAKRIRDIGFTYGVTLVTDPALARELYRTAVLGGTIAENLFQPVADIYRQHGLLNRKRRENSH